MPHRSARDLEAHRERDRAGRLHHRQSVPRQTKEVSDARKRLFQPFYRGEAHGRSQGLGLGLYIAAEIAKAHGGTIEVDSSKTETRFMFRMPLEGDGSLRPSPSTRVRGHPG
ncbi:sensor histidine kinase [Bradyrhizobium sp. 150]|nr:sensor histidine kinase [Bradyrhizobium sp. 150]